MQAGNCWFFCLLVYGGLRTAVGLPVSVPFSGWGLPLMASRRLLAATSEIRHMMHEFSVQGFFNWCDPCVRRRRGPAAGAMFAKCLWVNLATDVFRELFYALQLIVQIFGQLPFAYVLDSLWDARGKLR